MSSSIPRIFWVVALVAVLSYGVFDTYTTFLVVESGSEQQRLTEASLDRALAEAAAGNGVVPIDPDGEPYARTGILERGWQEATTDEETIRLWWETWPDAAVGIDYGANRQIVRYRVDLYESSDILRWSAGNFGVFGFIGVKFAIALSIVAAVYLVAIRVRWMLPVGIMLLLGFSFIGLYAGYSNLNIIRGGDGFRLFDLPYSTLFLSVLVFSVVAGLVIACLLQGSPFRTGTGKRSQNPDVPGDAAPSADTGAVRTGGDRSGYEEEILHLLALKKQGFSNTATYFGEVNGVSRNYGVSTSRILHDVWRAEQDE